MLSNMTPREHVEQVWSPVEAGVDHHCSQCHPLSLHVNPYTWMLSRDGCQGPGGGWLVFFGSYVLRNTAVQLPCSSAQATAVQTLRWL